MKVIPAFVKRVFMTHVFLNCDVYLEVCGNIQKLDYKLEGSTLDQYYGHLSTSYKQYMSSVSFGGQRPDI